MTHQPPAFHADAFHCPLCGVYANQSWGKCLWARYQWANNHEEAGIVAAKCAHCEEFSYWQDERLIFPGVSLVEAPNADLPSDCISDYREAANILNDSPRGAAALLRLAIQKLLKHLGKSGENINRDISELVSEGLPPLVQKSLDICRVVGNHAVHPGEIDFQDDPELAKSLFKLVNLIAYDRITQPKEVELLYSGLPSEAKAAIEKRDGP